MPVPKLSDDQRREALDKAAAARRHRAALKERVRAGEVDLQGVLSLADGDETIGKMRVAELLESFPRIGVKTRRRIMIDLDISQSRRLRGLGVRQRERLIAAFADRGTA